MSPLYCFSCVCVYLSLSLSLSLVPQAPTTQWWEWSWIGKVYPTAKTLSQYWMESSHVFKTIRHKRRKRRYSTTLLRLFLTHSFHFPMAHSIPEERVFTQRQRQREREREIVSIWWKELHRGRLSIYVTYLGARIEEVMWGVGFEKWKRAFVKM